MDKSEAELLFDVKQKFLREIPHPKLIQKQIDYLQVKFQLVETDNVFKPIDTASLVDFFEEYISLLMPLKLRVSNAKDAAKLNSQLLKLKHLQQNLIENLAALVEEIDFDIEKYSSVKQSEPFDVYQFSKELKEKALKTDNEIKDYLCQQIESKEAEELSELTKGVVRAVKILQNE
ncbi:hypothetical protein K6119_03985 [Paracrocinitomix mangrovi]|uniref:hypothetical protein n=1 Tax=Paracrocinitomix mangrovi TaxID=2862509 RepID=UPI001C8E9CE3|nr:hypothetical protein [Paracrocinitomix mangrovi]UKN02672.1 hypothetical protein K6119_03985 [Paracrocinitomix mangrovi]